MNPLTALIVAAVLVLIAQALHTWARRTASKAHAA